MSVTHLGRRAYSLSVTYGIVPRTLTRRFRPSLTPSLSLSSIYPPHSAFLHTSRYFSVDDNKSASPPSAAASTEQPPADDSEETHAEDKESDADRLLRAFKFDSPATTTPTTPATTSSSDQLIRDLSRIDWTDHLASDPTLYSEDIHDITTRLSRGQPLTTNQKITLLQFWLDKLTADPASFPVHPALTWTHPRGKGERPGRETPRMEERHVPVEYVREEVERLKLEERRRERRGRMTEFEAERRTYALKVSDVRRAYMAEWRAVKERREVDILKQWRATKAAAAARRQQTAEAHKADESELERQEEERYQQALQQRKQRVEVRVRKEEAAKRRRAAQLLQLLEQRKVKGVNQSTDASWGVRIDETLFAQTNKAVVGFWPSSMGPRAEE